MRQIAELVETLEVLAAAINAHDQPQSMEAVTIALMQFMDIFGHDRKILVATFPVLEGLKDAVDKEDFESASIFALGFLAKMRSVRDAMRRDNP